LAVVSAVAVSAVAVSVVVSVGRDIELIGANIMSEKSPNYIKKQWTQLHA
jgi:hypothetical protein